MIKISITLILLSIVSSALIIKDLNTLPNDIQIDKSDRTIQLNDKYPLQINKVTITTKSNTPVQFFYHVVPAQRQNKIADLTFQFKKADLKYEHAQYSSFHVYKVNLGQPLESGADRTLTITTRYINRYRNLPSTISLQQDQLLQYSDHLCYYSPYTIQMQISVYRFTKAVQYSPGGVKEGATGIKYSAFSIEKFNNTIITVHGINNEPQMLFTQVQKTIEISHWGNIAINQKYKAVNVGPSLKGQFSRVQYNEYNTLTGKNSLRKTNAILPYEVWGLYYQDQVGNISTSHAYRDEKAKNVKFEITPRFGLLGGWKSNWEIGYNLPTQGFLLHQDNHFKLINIDLGYELDKIIAQKYTLKIILPEGSSNIKILVDGKALDYSQSLSFSYLDFTGRPTLEINRGISGKAVQKSLIISYNFETKSLLKKPLLIFSAFLVFFLTFIIGSRISFKTLATQQHN